MPYDKYSKNKYLRIRSLDVGKPGGHYIKIGIRKAIGSHGGRSEIIGGLRKYKNKDMKTIKKFK